MGISAVLGLVDEIAGVGETVIASCMTAGVSGWAMVLSSSVAGVMRSCVLSLMMTAVSRLARRSITASFPIEVASDISPSGVPLEQLYIGDKDAVSAAAGENLVCVRHVYERSTLGAVFVAYVESDVVLHVELPCAFVVLEREA